MADRCLGQWRLEAYTIAAQITEPLREGLELASTSVLVHGFRPQGPDPSKASQVRRTRRDTQVAVRRPQSQGRRRFGQAVRGPCRYPGLAGRSSQSGPEAHAGT